MLAGLKRLVAGTPLETPARRILALTSNASVRKNSRDDDALRALIQSLPDDASCVDVGANLGHILEAMVHGCPQGQHIAFEPVPELAEGLRRRFPGVDVRAQAVAAELGRVTFTVVPGRPSRSGISATIDLSRDFAVKEIEAEVTTLDVALPVDYTPALVKCDVEGAELEVLQGATRVLRDKRPIVALEHQYGAHSHPERTAAIHDLLDSLDYQLHSMDGNALTGHRFAELVQAGTEWNFLAYPR